MSTKLTADDFKQSLNAHVALKGEEILEKYGPKVGWTETLQVLGDRSMVRYPCEVVFDSAPLQDGEFAHAMPNSEDPKDGFKIFIHPYFSLQLDRVPHLVFYQLVRVNYGEFASSDDAEVFGANALGISKDDYYETLCEMADELSGEME
jgi:hypothetical protein